MENENKVLIHFTNSPFTFTTQNAIFTKPYEDYFTNFKMLYGGAYQCNKCGGTALPSGKMCKRLNNQIIYRLWDEGKSIKEIQEQTGYSNTSIREHLLNYKKFSTKESIDRGIQKAANTKSKPVSQWTLRGQFVATYKSSQEAERITGIKSSNINKCLHKERISAGSFYWTLENELPNVDQKNLKEFINMIDKEI